MKEFTYVIQDEVGLHARPAGLLVKKGREYASKIILSAKGKSADITRLMAIMALGVKKGEEVRVTIEGEDEETAAEELKLFFHDML